MRLIARWMVALCVAAAVACGNAAPTTPSPTVAPANGMVSLTGFITAQSGSQLPDTTVTILDGPNALRFARTSLSGQYRFDRLVPGNANLSAVKNGYEERRGGLYIDGTNTFDLVLRTAAPWNTRGGANAGFDMPVYVTRVRIQATWRGTGQSHFSVSVGGVSIVSTILSELPNATYDGTHAVSGGRVQVSGSSNVAISWSLIEVRD